MSDTGLVTLIDDTTTIKVSSTLEKANGRKNLVDGSPETCWTSQQGLPQFIQLGFEENVRPMRLSITFQGGFVGTRCKVLVQTKDEDKNDWQLLTTVYPEDVNRPQVFDLKPAIPYILGNVEKRVTAFKLIFEESSDFFGRITIYDLKVEGRREGAQ